MKKKLLIGVCTGVLISILTVMALAANPVKLIVNGKEIKSDVPPQIINGRTMVPVRWVAQALGADVQWTGDAVKITGRQSVAEQSVSKEQVSLWIKEQGVDGANSYYIEGLSFEQVNIDADRDLEVMAKIDGAVHLGQFFIFDQNSAGKYQLIVEQAWKVENWDADNPTEIDGKKIYKLVTRTGGTGLDIFEVHLWYLEQGKFIEAWQGTLMERSMAFSPESRYKKVGSYWVDGEGKQLYVWETTHQLAEDGVTPVGEIKNSAALYHFSGTGFVK